MLLKFYRNEISLGKCLWGWYKLPRICKTKADLMISWLGGCIVWSRLKRTSKDTNGV
jgi:hypothetical protein